MTPAFPSSTAAKLPPSSSDPTNPNAFDLSAFPTSASNFDEQLIAESLHDPHLLGNPALLAQAHRQLGRYYAAGGRADLAGTEYARAVLADPSDYRGYAGLAQISDAVGAPAGDGSVDLYDVAQRLQDAGNQANTPADPDLQVAQPTDSAQWQATTAEFNRRMNSVYTSNAWSGVNRTVFTNLYGH